MVSMLYLNDVKGGKLSFYFSHKIQTKKALFNFPGTYTHMHQGNPPLSGKNTLSFMD